MEVPPGLGSSDEAAVVTWSDTRLANQGTAAQDIFGARVELSGGRSVWLQIVIALSVALALVGIGLLIAARRRRSSSTASTA